jgi:hypothetical protein
MFHRNTQDASSGPFEPDTLLSSQYFGRLRSSERSGERRLLVAVLEDGVLTYLKYAHATDPKARELFEEAARWIESSETDLMAFETICHTVGLEPEYIRRGLRARTQKPMRAAAEALRIEVTERERRAANGE